MKLLFLLPVLPQPADSGAKLRNEALLRLASRGHEVHALAFGDSSVASQVEGVSGKVHVVPPPAPVGRAQRAARLFGSDAPDLVQRFRSEAFRGALEGLLQRERFDAVQFEGLEMAGYLSAMPRHGGPARIYDARNAEILLQRRAFEVAVQRRQPRDALAVPYSAVQWRRLERFERWAVRSCDLTLCVSNHDANQMEALAGSSVRTAVVPNGIDVTRYPFRAPAASEPPNLLFLGKLDYRPNQEAVGWLVNELLPRLWEKVPEARLFLVGHNPPEWLVRAGQHDERIAVTGGVPDERPYLERAAVFALPLQVGGGSRLKALVALASGVPIVSTSLGVEGLELEPEADYLCADSTEQWVTRLTGLLGDAARRQGLAEHGRSTVERLYDWAAIAPALDAAYASLPRS